MKQWITLLLASVFLSGCGDSFSLPGSGGSGDDQGDLNQDYFNDLSGTVATMSITGNVLYYDTTPIATMANSTPVVSTYGEYQRGREQNVLTINNIEFLVYGNDGAVAAECTPTLANPEYGPTNENCSTASVVGFTKFVVCAPRIGSASISYAQVYPGANATLASGQGMVCWTNGVPENSDRMFTF